MQRMNIEGDLGSGSVGGEHLVRTEIQRQLRHRNVDFPNANATSCPVGLFGWYTLGDCLKTYWRIDRDPSS